ncbi:MAG: DUF6252 family protein [Flavisolibacter sp.]
MKQKMILCLGLSILIISSCKNAAQSDAEKQAGLITKTMKEHSPGSIPTSGNSYYMKATIDGKEWSASHMMPDDAVSSSYKMIHGADGESYITFQLWKRGVEVGKKIPFSSDNAANLSIEGTSGFFSGQIGEVEITKMDDQWLEGKFHFTATSSSSDKKVGVTNGSFRVALVPGLK